MGGLSTFVNLNIFPLGSYAILIGMGWLEEHRVKLGCYSKRIECIDDEGNTNVIKGIPCVIFVRNI